MSRGEGPSARVRAYVEFTLRHARWIWIAALLLAVPAIYRTVYLYAHLRSDLEQLLPRDAPSVRALDEMRKRSPGLQFLGVVVQAQKTEDLPGAERFLGDLAARIRHYPKKLVRDVRDSNQIEHDFLEKNAPLYVSLADLKEVRHRIEERRDYEVSKEAGQLLDEDEAPPSIDMSDIEKKYDTRVAGESEGHFTSTRLKASMLSVEAGEFSTGVEQARELLGRVKADVAALDLNKYAKGLRIGYASDVAINVEELDALESDLSVSSLVVVVAVMGVIVGYYRWWKSVLVLFPPLLLAAVYAFSIASLPPMGVTELNSNTAFLGSIIIGNGINVGLILLARYREERMRNVGVDEAIVTAVWGARPGTLAAAAAASASYASLIVTEFRGFRQFGIIGGVGMLTAWGTAFLLVPPLLKWLDHDPPRARRVEHSGRIMSALAQLVEKRAPFVAAFAALLAVLALVKVSSFDASWLEHDFSKLRRADTWKNGAGYWGRTMDAVLGRYLTPTVLLGDSAPQMEGVEQRVRKAVEQGPLEPFVARVIGKDDVLPQDQPAKIEEVTAIRAALTPKIRSLIPEDRRKQVDRLLGTSDLTPIGVNDLPHSFTMGLRERDGSIGRTLLVYPRPSQALWKANSIHEFVSALRELGRSEEGGAARVAGSIPLSDDILASITHDGPLACAVSLALVVVIVFAVVGFSRVSFYALASLLLGVLWLCGATMALGIRINFSNFIAFPITFGIGIDYAANVMARYVQEGEEDVGSTIRSTGGAVALCSLTTIIGYSSLLLAKNRALFLFGLLAVTGEVACLSAAIIALPAWLLVRQHQRQRRRARREA